MYLLKEVRASGRYVALPGSEKSYTKDLIKARIFKTKEDAEKNRCIINEVIVSLESQLTIRNF